MINKIFNKNISFEELYILFFPIAVILRSAFLNIYILVGAILLFLKIIKGKYEIKNKILFYGIVFFIFYLIIASINAENIFTSLKSSISQLRFIFFAFFISSLNLQKIDFKKIILIFSIIVNFVSADTLYQYYYGHDFFGIENDENNPHRLSGPFGKELIVGAFIAIMSIPIIAYLTSNINQISNFQKNYLFFSTILSFFTVLMSGERISLLILICSSFIIFLKNLNIKKIIIIFSLLVLVIFGAYKNIKSVNYKINEFAGLIMLMNESPHIKLFSSAIIVGSKNIIIGTGLKNYRVNCDALIKENYFDKFTNDIILCSSHPHNIYLEIFAECGIIGLILFLFLVIVNFQFFWKKRKEINDNIKFIFFSSLIILAAYLWPIRSSGSFFSTFSASFFWYFYGLLLLCINNNKQFKSNQSEQRSN